MTQRNVIMEAEYFTVFKVIVAVVTVNYLFLHHFFHFSILVTKFEGGLAARAV